ncbi:unnamed protein product [Nesidiocoris tenuis]|uniref:U11/U12 small nuclear ribonucleoprotein 35 kDa protein n=1 Tax=Nesidiocoris tenuis TaxID=355587 RepID=A0A6H5GHL1_9HEMI|nr:unnamed protein product [Nesidiocoris tenuis]
MVSEALDDLFQLKVLYEGIKGAITMTNFGTAIAKANISCETGKYLFDELREAQKKLVLVGDLHLLYLITPHAIAESIRPVEEVVSSVYSSLTPKELYVASCLGLTEVVIARLMMGRSPPKQTPTRVLEKFFTCLVLYQLWKGNSLLTVANRFRVDRGVVHNLLAQTTSYASSVIRFCDSIESLWPFAKLLSVFPDRLSYCCSADLLPLMELPAVKLGRAKQLYRAGFKTVLSIAKADPHQLKNCILHLPLKQATQLINVAKLMVRTKFESLQEEAEMYSWIQLCDRFSAEYRAVQQRGERFDRDRITRDVLSWQPAIFQEMVADIVVVDPSVQHQSVIVNPRTGENASPVKHAPDNESSRLSRLAERCWAPLAIVYDPLRAGSIDSTDTIPHDRAIIRAQNADFRPNQRIAGRPECTIFVGRLAQTTSAETLRKEFRRYGRVVGATVVEDIITGRSRGYGFVEYATESEASIAYKSAHKSWLDGSRIFVDMECGRVLPGWVPRRLGKFRARERNELLVSWGKLSLKNSYVPVRTCAKYTWSSERRKAKHRMRGGQPLPSYPGMKSGVDVYCTSLGDANEGVCLSWGLLQKHGVEIAADLPAERQLWFLRLTARLYKALTGPLHDFSGMDFKFSRVNYKSLDGLLNQEDRPAFSIDQTNIDPIELYKLNAYGMVKYAVGEDFAPDALQKRKKRYAM